MLPAGADMGAPPNWDIDVRRRFEYAGRRFDLQLRIASHARRLILFGPSGAGKSQTLKVIAGLTTADAGHVRLAGRTLWDHSARIDMPARDRRIGYVFQDYALFPHLTVAQNVGFGLLPGLRNPGRRATPPQVLRWLNAFGLSPLAHHYPEQLSGGQRQRTALARALVTEPHALLLDEPFAALDTLLRVRLRNELAEWLDRLAIPMMLITHDPADIDSLADEVVTLFDGRVSPAGGATAATI